VPISIICTFAERWGVTLIRGCARLASASIPKAQAVAEDRETGFRDPANTASPVDRYGAGARANVATVRSDPMPNPKNDGLEHNGKLKRRK
jgi:hypothetical protein